MDMPRWRRIYPHADQGEPDGADVAVEAADGEGSEERGHIRDADRLVCQQRGAAGQYDQAVHDSPHGEASF